MRVLFIGDIVGTPGVNLVKQGVPILRRERQLDFVIANAENSAAGSGLYPSNLHALKKAEIDAFTMGDHIYRRPEIVPLLEHGEPIAKPANYPAASPGKPFVVLRNERGLSLVILSLLGRLYMKPIDCPLLKLDELLPAIKAESHCILVDFHAEATGEKYMAKHYFDGRVSALVGTHTHVPTADAQITREGMAYISDVGMTGGHAGVLGRKAKPILEHAFNQIPTIFEVEDADPRLNGVIIQIDELTGKATQIEPLVWRPSNNQS